MKLLKVYVPFIVFLIFNCMGNYSSSPHVAWFTTGSHNIRNPDGQSILRIGEGQIIEGKVGRACNQGIFISNIFYYDRDHRENRITIDEAAREAARQKAKASAGIARIAVIDYESTQFSFFWIFSIYSRECIVVYGDDGKD